MTTNTNLKQFSALEASARAYALNGFLKITNLFTRSEIEAISKIYDEYHSSIGRITTNGESRIPPTGSLLENNPQLTEIIFGKSDLLDVVRAATGADVQFAGSDAVHVYNDSVGIHRDTFYKYDFPKILIFLSDTPCKTNFTNPIEKNHAGTFLVMPGTHTLGDQHTALSSRLCNWPYEDSDTYCEITPDFTFVQAGRDSTKVGRELAQERKNLNKYSAFTKIVFRKGDVVLFSTRMLHALYPLFEDGQKPQKEAAEENKCSGSNLCKAMKSRKYEPIKLLGILLIEGYSMQNGELIENAIKRAENSCSSISEELREYIATVYNLRLYNTIVDHGAAAEPTISQVSGKAMGLNRSLPMIRNHKARHAVARHNIIHEYYEKNSWQIDKAAGLNPSDIKFKFLEHLKQHDKANYIQDVRIQSNLDILSDEPLSSKESNLEHSRNWQGIAKYLPLIKNERVYLFYKKMAAFLRLN